MVEADEGAVEVLGGLVTKVERNLAGAAAGEDLTAGLFHFLFDDVVGEALPA